MEETQSCPIEKRKVLHVPLKTFGLGNNLSALQADLTTGSLYQITKSKDKPAEVIIYSAFPGSMGRFTISRKDIVALEVNFSSRPFFSE